MNFTRCIFGKFAFIFLLLTHTSFLAFADTSPTSIPSGNLSQDQIKVLFDQICKTTLSNTSSSSSGSNSQSQLLQYCQAAQSAQTAARASSTIWKVWAAVSAVCVAACAASFAGIGNQFICIGINVVASIADAVETKNYMNSMMAIMSIAPSVMINQSMNQSTNKDSSPTTSPTSSSGKTNEKNPPKKKDVGACILGAQAAYQAFSSHSNMNSQLANAKNNLASALSAASNASDTTTGANNSAPSLSGQATSGNTAANGGSLANGSTSISGGSSGSAPNQNVCSSNFSASPSMLVQCAVAMDSTLPKYVESPRFAENIKQISGMNLGDFLSKSDSPSKTMGVALSGTFNPDSAGKMTAALQTMEKQMSQGSSMGLGLTSRGDTPSSVYAGGGHVGNTQGSAEPDMSQMMSNLMGQFGPKTDDPSQQKSGIESVIFAYQHQTPGSISPNSISEDRRLSLFDRVTYRYFFIDKRFQLGFKGGLQPGISVGDSKL